MGIRQDLRDYAMAARRRWPVSDEMKAAALQAAIDVLEIGNAREKIAAASLIATVEKQNQADEHKVVDVRTQQGDFDLASIAAEIGVDFGVVSNAEIARIGGDSVDSVDG